MNRESRVIAASFLLLVLAGASVSLSQAFGRVTMKVVDQSGEAIVGAQITVTCDEIPAFHDKGKTNKKGRATLAFVDATKIYSVQVEAEGYASTQLNVKAEVRGTTEEIVVLGTVGSQAVEDGREIVYSATETLFNEGVKLMQAGDLEAAKTIFLETLEKKDDMPGAHAALAAVYLGQQDYEAALAAAARVQELTPENPAIFRILYEAHKGLGNDAQADQALRALAKQDQHGDATALLYNEGVAALKMGDRESAKKRFLEALEVQPDLVPALALVATLSVEDGLLADGATMAERALALEPGNKRALRARYDAYRGLGDTEKEQEAFDRLAAADPTALAEQFMTSGIALFNGGDAGAAIDQFELALAADSNLPRAHYRLGLALVGTGDSAKARLHLEKFIEMTPDDPEVASAREMLSFLQ